MTEANITGLQLANFEMADGAKIIARFNANVGCVQFGGCALLNQPSTGKIWWAPPIVRRPECSIWIQDRDAYAAITALAISAYVAMGGRDYSRVPTEICPPDEIAALPMLRLSADGGGQ